MACTHDHSCEDDDCSSNWSLYKHIDLSKVTALNEANPGSVKSVFKAWEERLNSTGEHLESNEGDPELLVYIPFTSDVKIKSISIVGGADGTKSFQVESVCSYDYPNVAATIVYEITPNPSDHKTRAETCGGPSHVE
ncbi:Detected protein of confused Function [Hibiscus syriacus]|uniref:Detected protein of confused Function n=1 Tax=Hibiscus syriacus TaxID=106335 RepID=A0A6A2WUS3_HIBSY|nr:Detected protein of confused Function [Hibiscus syriacus]